MSTTINASTSSGLVQTADTSGILELQSNGSTKMTVTGTGVYGSLVSSVAQTASGTAVNFLDIPSWVKRITVMFSGVSTNGTSTPLIQIGDAGGIEASGYLGSGGYVNNASATSVATQTTGFALNAVGAATIVYHGIATLQLLDATTNAWVFNTTLGRSDGNLLCFGGGSKSLSATLDRIRITTVNGTDTFDAGTINIMYEG